MTEKYKDRNTQIKEAVFNGDLKRAQGLVKHDKGQGYRNNYKAGKEPIYSMSPEVEYNTRGNRDEERALAVLSYTGDEPKPEREFKLKTAKIYHQIIQDRRKGREGYAQILRDAEKKYGLNINTKTWDEFQHNSVYGAVHGIAQALQNREDSKLEKSVTPVVAVLAIGASIFFLNSSLTGNAIANLSNTTSSWIGGVLFCVGIVGCFFWLKAKKK